LEVSWTGSIWSFSATAGFGGQFSRFSLESECKCNTKFKIKGFASFITMGAGLELVGAGSTLFKDAAGTEGGLTMIDDYRGCPDPFAANGSAWSSGINLVGGVGGALLTVTRLGRLKSSSAVGGPNYGFDISVISTFYGHSVITSVEEDCCSQ